MPAYARAFEAAGFGDAIASMQAAWTRGGVEAAAGAAPEELVSSLGAVGSPRECADGLARYHAAGVDIVAAYPFPVGPDAAGSMRTTIAAIMGAH